MKTQPKTGGKSHEEQVRGNRKRNGKKQSIFASLQLKGKLSIKIRNLFTCLCLQSPNRSPQKTRRPPHRSRTPPHFPRHSDRRTLHPPPLHRPTTPFSPSTKHHSFPRNRSPPASSPPTLRPFSLPRARGRVSGASGSAAGGRRRDEGRRPRSAPPRRRRRRAAAGGRLSGGAARLGFWPWSGRRRPRSAGRPPGPRRRA